MLRRILGTSLCITMLVFAGSSAVGDIVIDDFSSGNLSAYTPTVVLNASGAAGVFNTETWNDTTVPGQLSLDTTVYDGIQQMAFTRSDFSLADGDELQADFLNPQVGTGRNLGLYVGNAAPTTGMTDARSDFLTVHSIISNNAQNGGVQARWFDGTVDSPGAIVVPTATDPFETYFIKRLSNVSYELGLYNAGIRQVIETVPLTSPNEANYLGFYADVREVGTLGTVDNLRIVTAIPEPSSLAFLGLAAFAGLVRRRKS